MSRDNLNKNIEKCKEFNEILNDILYNETVQEMNKYIQHGEISCYSHCYYVAYYTYLICKKLKLDYKSAARGGNVTWSILIWLAHYISFWHKWNGAHAWAHPRIALKNATKIFNLNKTEQDIIKNHMWPVTIKFPKTKEAL